CSAVNTSVGRLALAAAWLLALAVPAVAQAAPAGPPANDMFANAQTASAVQGIGGTTKGATREAGEPIHAYNAGGHSIWYRWTPATSGNVTIDTIGSGFDTLL